MQTEFLFVYGTLMSLFNNSMAQYLRNNSWLINNGYFNGYLFDLGNFPGAVYNSQVKSKVYGEVYQVNRIEEVLKTLDNYEGVDDPNFNIYKRKIIPVNINKKIINATTYVYIKPFASFKKIESGNYSEYLKEKS